MANLLLEMLPTVVDAAVNERVVRELRFRVGTLADLDDAEEAAIASDVGVVALIVEAENRPHEAERQAEAQRPHRHSKNRDFCSRNKDIAMQRPLL